MKILFLTILGIFLLISLPALSQNNKFFLNLQLHDGHGPFSYLSPPVRWNDSSILFKGTYPKYQGIPPFLKDVKVGIICFDKYQYAYQNYMSGNLTEHAFRNLVNSFGNSFNEDSLTSKPINCFVSLVTGKNNRNEEMIVIDANNNFDFNDDYLFQVPNGETITDENQDDYLHMVSAERMLNGKIINDQVPILILKFGSSISYNIAQYATAKFTILGDDFNFAIRPLYFADRSWRQSELVLLNTSERKGNGAIPLPHLREGDFMRLNNNTFEFKGVIFSENRLQLQLINKNLQYSPQPGFLAPDFQGVNLLTKKKLSLSTLQKGKYLLIEFWGTWCAPCIAQLPDLKELYSTADTSRFQILSIASSDLIERLKNVIKTENMLWPQMLSDTITNQYNVTSFPSNFLISPDGLVFRKNVSIPDLKELMERLDLLLE